MKMFKKFVALLVLMTPLVVVNAGEHPDKSAEKKEHAGEKAEKKEHAGDAAEKKEHAGDAAESKE